MEIVIEVAGQVKSTQAYCHICTCMMWYRYSENLSAASQACRFGQNKNDTQLHKTAKTITTIQNQDINAKHNQIASQSMVVQEAVRSVCG